MLEKVVTRHQIRKFSKTKMMVVFQLRPVNSLDFEALVLTSVTRPTRTRISTCPLLSTHTALNHRERLGGIPLYPRLIISFRIHHVNGSTVVYWSKHLVRGQSDICAHYLRPASTTSTNIHIYCPFLFLFSDLHFTPIFASLRMSVTQLSLSPSYSIP